MPTLGEIHDLVEFDTNGGCWIASGSVRHGGHVYWPRIGSAHRTAWVAAYGPVPEGKWVLHKCDVPACCNPNHLKLGHARENLDDYKNFLANKPWMHRVGREIPDGRRAVTYVTDWFDRRLKENRYLKRVTKDEMARMIKAKEGGE